MAFTIVLQRSSSEKNRVDKTLTTVLSLTGTLKAETSIVDPVFVAECDLTAVTGVNYCTISSFGRSYFVNNIRSIRNGLVEFSCHVDVLSTYASQIRANKAIIQKQERQWNLYLNDGSFKIYQNPSILTQPFPSGFSVNQFVLAIAGA